MIITETWVPGHPRTKGSLAAKGGYATDTPQSKRWRALMAECVRRDILRRSESAPVGSTWPYAGAVEVTGIAFLAVPILPHAQAELAGIAPPAIWHNAGDVDKLARNLLDAIAADAKSAVMNGGAIVNDNQVIRLVSEKYPAAPELGPGMLIVVWSVSPEVHAAYLANVAIRATAVARGSLAV